MTLAPIVMYAVAGTAALGGTAVLLVRGTSEAATYAKRISATMLFALAIILGGFATAMARWSAGA